MIWFIFAVCYIGGGLAAVALEQHLALRRKETPLTLDYPWLALLWPAFLVVGVFFLFAWSLSTGGRAIYWSVRKRRRP